jgi:hypothetical protein
MVSDYEFTGNWRRWLGVVSLLEIGGDGEGL